MPRVCTFRPLAVGVPTAAALVLLGCQGAAPDSRLIEETSMGEFGRARVHVTAKLPETNTDRDYLRGRLKLGMLGLSDGLPASSERTFQEIYEVLDTKGVNKDKAFVSWIINEDLKIWKGEPFEQALAWNYMALRAGSVFDWDNMRAAADSSLFLLADFGTNEKGERKSTEEIGQEAANQKEDGDKYLTEGYVTEQSNFTLGYLSKGIAAQAMVRADEAGAQFDQALKCNPDLASIVSTLKSGSYNTVLFVDYGQGPQKIGYGPDNALAKFVPWQGFGGDQRPLSVSLGSASPAAFPVAHDVNAMAADHMWNSLQNARLFKSYLGTGLILGGAVAASSGNRDAAWVGLGFMLAGAIAKAGAHADTRYCELMPQRTYVVPLTINQPDTAVTLQIGDDQSTRMILPGLSPPVHPEKVHVRYVRLPHHPAPGAWACCGKVGFANDHYQGAVEGDTLPYILGGRCVRAPSSETLSRYHRAGNLTHMTAADLENLYRAEGITWRSADEASPRLHILEGGDSLVPPLAGTTGFARLFCQDHSPYNAKSKELQQAVESLRQQQPSESQPRAQR